MSIKAEDLILKLRNMHPEGSGWFFLKNFRSNTGYSISENYLDAWAINAYHGKIPNLCRAFEVKVDPSDVLRELRNPDKRWKAYAISHEFYFVAPKGLIGLSKLGKDDGLIELTDMGILEIVKKPRIRELMPPRWDFVASLVRRIIQLEKQKPEILDV